LKVSISFRDLGLKLVLVACNEELLGVVVVFIWGVKDEAELGALSAISGGPFEVVAYPSKGKKEKSVNQDWKWLRAATANL
jgi:hypothetical protein